MTGTFGKSSWLLWQLFWNLEQWHSLLSIAQACYVFFLIKTYFPDWRIEIIYFCGNVAKLNELFQLMFRNVTGTL